MTPTMVAAVCFLIFVLILVWDAWLYADKTDRNSISQVIIDVSGRLPIVPALIGFFVGLMFGHWWG